jgi:hypothetical protein
MSSLTFHHYTLTRDLLDSAVECMKIPNITTFEHLFKTAKESIAIDKLNLPLFTTFVDKNLFDINKSFGSRLKKSDKKLKSICDAMFGSVGILIDYKKRMLKLSTLCFKNNEARFIQVSSYEKLARRNTNNGKRNIIFTST